MKTNRRFLKPITWLLLSAFLLLSLFNNCGKSGFQTLSSSSLSSQSVTAAAAVAQGKNLYANNCMACHGAISLFAYGSPSSDFMIQTFANRIEMVSLKGRFSKVELDSISVAIASAKSAAGNPSTPSLTCSGSPAIVAKTLYKRMTYREYLNSVRDLLGKSTLTVDINAYPQDYYSTMGFDTDDASIRINPAEAESLINISTDVVTQALADMASPFNACVVSAGATAYKTCLQNLFTKTARIAFRRPVIASEVSALVDLALLATNTPKDGVVFALASLIASPRFLFHVIDYTSNRNGDMHTLNQYEFASRLSFLIWSSIPDETLLGLADSGQLMVPANVSAQVQRMLKSPKAGELMRSFPNQWLNLRKVAAMDRDLTITPQFTPTLKVAMVKEGELLFTDVVQNALPIDTLATSNYTFANKELAQFYGLSYPTSSTSEYAKVTMDTSSRRGLLTQAGIMTATSTGNTTSAVKRGIFYLNRVLCQALGPPPPSVPSLSRIDPSLSAKERMALHRTNVNCASCHDMIDPVGLAYDNFNSIGQFRTVQGSYTIDASGKTTDGFSFRTAADLGNWIGQGDKFETCLAIHLSSYGLGRQVLGQDTCNVMKVVNDSKSADGSVTIPRLLENMINSDFFKMSKVTD